MDPNFANFLAANAGKIEAASLSESQRSDAKSLKKGGGVNSPVFLYDGRTKSYTARRSKFLLDKYNDGEGISRAIHGFDAAALSKISLMKSRVGGVPDLPLHYRWPSVRGKLLPFVMQLWSKQFPCLSKKLGGDGSLFVFASMTKKKLHVKATYIRECDEREWERREVDESLVLPDWQEQTRYPFVPIVPGPLKTGASVEPVGALFGTIPDASDCRERLDGVVLQLRTFDPSPSWSDDGSLVLSRGDKQGSIAVDKLVPCVLDSM